MGGGGGGEGGRLESGGINIINVEKFISALNVACVKRNVHSFYKKCGQSLCHTNEDIMYI